MITHHFLLSRKIKKFVESFRSHFELLRLDVFYGNNVAWQMIQKKVEKEIKEIVTHTVKQVIAIVEKVTKF